MMKIYLTNLSMYTRGLLVGEWVSLPVSDDALEEVKRRIGLNEQCSEYFITDYETDLDGMVINEYDNIEELNALAQILEDSECDAEVLEALMLNGYSLAEAIEKKDDVTVFYGCYDEIDVAVQYCEEFGILDEIPDHLRFYFDFAAYGRDIAIENSLMFTKNNNCVVIWQ